jgi:hypothetical protein
MHRCLFRIPDEPSEIGIARMKRQADGLKPVLHVSYGDVTGLCRTGFSPSPLAAFGLRTPFA